MRGVYNWFVFPSMEFLLCMFVRNHTACKVTQVYTAFPLVFKKEQVHLNKKMHIYETDVIYIIIFKMLRIKKTNTKLL